MVSAFGAALARRMAWRKLPAPASCKFATVISDGKHRFSNPSTLGRIRRAANPVVGRPFRRRKENMRHLGRTTIEGSTPGTSNLAVPLASRHAVLSFRSVRGAEFNGADIDDAELDAPEAALVGRLKYQRVETGVDERAAEAA